MKKYLYISMCCFGIAIIGIMLICSGCATRQTWMSSCGENSVLAIATAGKDYPTRVVYGYASQEDKKNGICHAQTEFRKDGAWRPLQVYYWPVVVEGLHEFELIDKKYMSGADVLEKYKKMLK